MGQGLSQLPIQTRGSFWLLPKQKVWGLAEPIEVLGSPAAAKGIWGCNLSINFN